MTCIVILALACTMDYNYSLRRPTFLPWTAFRRLLSIPPLGNINNIRKNDFVILRGKFYKTKVLKGALEQTKQAPASGK